MNSAGVLIVNIAQNDSRQRQKYCLFGDTSDGESLDKKIAVIQETKLLLKFCIRGKISNLGNFRESISVTLRFVPA